jgi:hypothetical protein
MVVLQTPSFRFHRDQILSHQVGSMFSAKIRRRESSTSSTMTRALYDYLQVP